MVVKQEPILPPDVWREIEYALRDDVGRGTGLRATRTPDGVSDGVEFEIGEENGGGVFVGVTPNWDEDSPEFMYTEVDSPIQAYLYVYVVDIDAHKSVSNEETGQSYAVLEYESEFFRALSKELDRLVSDAVGVDDVVLERCMTDDGGVYFVRPFVSEL